MTSRTNYIEKTDREIGFIYSYLEDHNLNNIIIEYYKGHALPGLKITDLKTHNSACISFDNNKNRAKGISRFCDVIYNAEITDPEVLVKVFKVMGDF